MIINHSLNTHFKFFSNCPKCGNSYLEKDLQIIKTLINQIKRKKIHLKNFRGLITTDNKIFEKNFKCHKCKMTIKYIVDFTKSIQGVK